MRLNFYPMSLEFFFFSQNIKPEPMVEEIDNKDNILSSEIVTKVSLVFVEQ